MPPHLLRLCVCVQAKELGGLLGVSEEAAKMIIEKEPALSYHTVGRLKDALKKLSSVLKVCA